MSDPLYRTKVWQEVRLHVLARDNYICQHCMEDGTLTPAVMVHHVKHLDRHPELAIEPDNLLSLCDLCHAKAHRRGYKRKEKIIRRARVIKG